jgi:hypothetical protein
VADEQKQSRWKSLPGVLTTATGLVAALSGLVAGLNQLGVFRREPSAAQAVSAAPAPRESTHRDSAAAVIAESASTNGHARASAPARPTTAPTPTPPITTAKDTAAAESQRLPKGTALDLTVPSRTCAPSTGQKRFTARLAAPVKVGGATLLPAGTTAVLHLRRDGSSGPPQVRLDSLVQKDQALSVPTSEVRLRRGAANGACLRAGARISATLGAPIPLRRQ